MKRQFLPMIAALGCLAGLVTSSCFSPIPSGEQLSKNDASVLSDMATPRKCAGFEAYEGTELACWDFKDEATRNAAVVWASTQSAPTKSCWTVADDNTLRGDLPNGLESELVLTAFLDTLHVGSSASEIDTSQHRSVVLGVRYRTIGDPPSSPVAKLKANIAMDRGLSYEAQLGLQSTLQVVTYGFPSPGSLMGVSLLFLRPKLDQKIFIQSVIVLGIPR